MPWAPELRDFATTNTPELHREAADRAYLEQIRGEAVRLGLAESPEVFSGDILWALSSRPAAAPLPDGLRFEPVTREWLNDQIAAGRFENGAGTAGASAREQRNRYGIALLGARNEVIALAGVFDTYGLSEIGVDVVEAQQGRGLGAAVVSAAIRASLERGETPLYGCSRTNIRSQRTALASGFLPVCAEGAVV